METEGGSQLFETQKREGHEKWAVKSGGEGVMQIYARDNVEVHGTEEKGSSLIGKKKKKEEKKNNGTLWI